MTIKVLIVDDSALMRALLAEIISGAADLEVVGAAPRSVAHIARSRTPSAAGCLNCAALAKIVSRVVMNKPYFLPHRPRRARKFLLPRPPRRQLAMIVRGDGPICNLLRWGRLHPQ